MSTGNQQERMSLRDLLKASWVKTSIKLGLILVVVAVVAIGVMKIFNVAASPLFTSLEVFFMNYGLAGIFIATILAGTVVPLGSPALVAVAAFFVDPLQLILVASVGFTIGMTVNYALAYKLGRPYVTRKLGPNHLEEVTRAWSSWGMAIYVVFGLIPVLPVELLSFVCGLLKTNIPTFLTLSFVPRLIVFTLIVYFGQYLGAWIGV